MTARYKFVDKPGRIWSKITGPVTDRGLHKATARDCSVTEARDIVHGQVEITIRTGNHKLFVLELDQEDQRRLLEVIAPEIDTEELEGLRLPRRDGYLRLLCEDCEHAFHAPIPAFNNRAVVCPVCQKRQSLKAR